MMARRAQAQAVSVSKRIRASFRLFTLATTFALASAAESNRYYRVENIPTPAGVEPNCNGLSFLPDGRLVAAFDEIGRAHV